MNKTTEKDKSCLFCKAILPNYINITGSSCSYYTECEICKIRYGINYMNFYQFNDHIIGYFLLKYIIQKNKYIIRINFKKENDIVKFEVQTDKDIILFDTFDEANKYYYRYINNLLFI